MIMLGLVLAVLGERRVGLVAAAAEAGWFLLATRVLIPAAGGEARPSTRSCSPASATRWARSSGPWPSTRAGCGTWPPCRPGGLLLARARGGGLLSAGRPAGPAHLAAADGCQRDLGPCPDPRLQVPLHLDRSGRGVAGHGGGDGLRRPGHTTRRVLAGVLWPSPWSPTWPGRRRRWAASSTTAGGAGPIPGTPPWAALQFVPDGAGVSGLYNLIPHLTHRTYAYEYPNPWRVSNWGAHGETRPTRPRSTIWSSTSGCWATSGPCTSACSGPTG